NCTMANVDDNNPLSSQNLLTCRVERCNNLGDCVILNGSHVCNCMLGYLGDECEGTVNYGIAAPLTLGVLAVLVIFIVLAFVVAFIQQRRRERL
ncbi:meprin A subunit alpha-like, partial [Clarias magur]